MNRICTLLRHVFPAVVLAMAFVMPHTARADKTDEIAALRKAADSLHSIGRTDSAAVVGQRAVALAEKTGDPVLTVGAHAAQGVYLRSLGRVDEALACYGKALETVTSGAFRHNPSQEAIEETASLYINLAVLQLDMQQKNEAAKNAVNAAGWVARSKDAELKSMIYGVAGSVLTGCDNLAAAMKYQKLAYAGALEAGNDEAAFRAAAYTLLIADRRADNAAVKEWRARCRELQPKVSSAMAQLVYYQAECSICLKHGAYKESVVWFNRILGLDGIDNLPFVKLDCYGNLHDAYARTGDYRNAYETLVKAYGLRNELWEQEKSRSLQELTVKYDAREKELALAQSEVRSARMMMWLFVAVGLLLAGTVVFIVYAGRQKRRRMRQYISGLENERRRMAAELHDGVCNDLLAVQMKMAQGEPPASTARMLGTCREAVRRISHELMPPEFAYADISEVAGWFVAKQSDTHKGRIAFSYTQEAVGAAWADVDEGTALEVYRIIQEAVGNAVKHSGAGRISVSLALHGKELTVAVTDDGTYKSTGRKGVGEESMRRRASAIGAAFTIKTDEKQGTEVKLSAKIK